MELFQSSKQNVSLHINNIFKEGELIPESVVKESFTTATDGKRYKTKLYNLDVIISVGYRVKSVRGTQFLQWANKVLKEYHGGGAASIPPKPASKQETTTISSSTLPAYSVSIIKTKIK